MRPKSALMVGAMFCILIPFATGALTHEEVEGAWYGTALWYEVDILTGGNHEFILDLPIDISGRIVWILLWQNLSPIGAFLGGLFPVWYAERDTGMWIAGPTVAIGGTGLSQSEGKNGDRLGQFIVEGGLFTNGGSIQLLDDGPFETDSRNQWTLEVYWPESAEIPEDPRVVIIVQPNI